MTDTLDFSLRKKILYALIINLGFFAILEATLRVGAYFIYDRSPYFLFYGVKAFMADGDPNGHSVAKEGYFKFPPSRVLHQYGLFHEPTPIQINSAGFRGGEFRPEKPAGLVRVVCLGGSSTFGFFDRDPYTYPAILERLFAEQPVPGIGRVEVINAGIPHAKSNHILAMVQNEILDYDPDFLTLYSAFNDASFVMDANALQRAFRWLHSHFATWVAVKRLVSALGGPDLHSRWSVHVAGAKPEHVQRQIELHVEKYDRVVRELVALAKERGVQPIFIKQPIDMRSEEARKAGLSYAETVAAARARWERGLRLTGTETTYVIHSALIDVLERVAAENGIPVVDNIAIVDEHPEYMASYVHLTEEANAALAQALYRPIARLAAERYAGLSSPTPEAVLLNSTR